MSTHTRDEVRLPADPTTPALLVDLVAFDENLSAASRMLAGTAIRLRPHIKTHRTPALALRQMQPGVTGVTCATVGEAEAMVDAGITDVLLANEVVDDSKIRRMTALAGRARVTVAVDHEQPVATFSAWASRYGVTVGVLIDVDVGLRRCGVASPQSVAVLATTVADSPSLQFEGLMGYEGRLRSSTPDRSHRSRSAFHHLAAAKAAVEAAGLSVATVSGAGTSTLREALTDDTITEVQAGTYALMEPDLDGLGLPFTCAASVLATVISTGDDTVVLDAGRKTIGCDYGPPIPLADGATTVTVSEEHTVVSWRGPLPRLGDRVALRPSHVRTTFNLHDSVWLVRGSQLVERVPVSARGRSA